MPGTIMLKCFCLGSAWPWHLWYDFSVILKNFQHCFSLRTIRTLHYQMGKLYTTFSLRKRHFFVVVETSSVIVKAFFFKRFSLCCTTHRIWLSNLTDTFFIAKQGQRGEDVEQRAYVTQIIFEGPKTASFCDDHDEQKTRRPLASEKKTYSIVVYRFFYRETFTQFSGTSVARGRNYH